MKLNAKEIGKVLDQDDEKLDEVLDKTDVQEKMKKLLAKEKHADQKVYGSHDPKRVKPR
jgi:hypothetical protein